MKKLRWLLSLFKNNNVPDDPAVETKIGSEPFLAEEVEVVIGFDFGTSCSKVVVRIPDLPGSPAYPVDFGEYGHPSMPELLPTKLQLSEKGVYKLTNDNTNSIDNIKIKLMTEEDIDTKYEINASVYIGLTLKFVRSWFLINHKNVIPNTDNIYWSFNLGVPSPNIGDNVSSKRFKRIGKLGWIISWNTEDITVDDMRPLYANIAANEEYWNGKDNKCEFQIVPEIAAGAVSYARSTLRRPGLHFMLDFGASTVDACTFILRPRDGEDKYSLLVADVQPLGVVQYHKKTCEMLKIYNVDLAIEYERCFNPIDPIPDQNENVLDGEELQNLLLSRDIEFVDNVTVMLKKNIFMTNKYRAPNEDEWSSNPLPILIIGGGGSLKIYMKAIDEISDWIKRDFIRNPNGVRLLPLPITETPDGQSISYQRMAVAYGLSYRSLDIGDIVPVDSIEDMEKEERGPEYGEFISKDQV